MIEFRIERRSGVAAYAQIVQQTRDALLLGRLRIGDQLPTARQVVAHTGINPNTVLKAYRQLDAEGLVETRPGSGTFVVTVPDGVLDGAASPATAQLEVRLGEWLRDAKRAGLDRPSMEALFKSRLDETYSAAPCVTLRETR